LAVGLVRTSLCNGQLGIFGELISILLWRAHNSSNTLTFAQHVLHALKTDAATGSKNDTIYFGHLDLPRTWIKRTRSRDREAESNADGQEFYIFKEPRRHHASDHVTTQLIDCTVVTLSLLSEPFQNAIRVSTAIDKCSTNATLRKVIVSLCRVTQERRSCPDGSGAGAGPGRCDCRQSRGATAQQKTAEASKAV